MKRRPRLALLLLLTCGAPVARAAAIDDAVELRRSGQALVSEALKLADPVPSQREALELFLEAKGVLEQGLLVASEAESTALYEELTKINSLIFWLAKFLPPEETPDGADSTPEAEPLAEEDAQKLLATAKSYAAAHPDDKMLCLARYFEVAERCLGTRAGIEAQRLSLDAQRELLAQAGASSATEPAPKRAAGEQIEEPLAPECNAAIVVDLVGAPACQVVCNALIIDRQLESGTSILTDIPAGSYSLTFTAGDSRLAVECKVSSGRPVFLLVDFAKQKVRKRAEVAGGFYSGRLSDHGKLPRDFGWSRDTDVAVEWGLAWLARHQNLDGSWSVDTFGRTCTAPARPGQAPHGECDGGGIYTPGSPAVTALSLLAFLGSGESGHFGHHRTTIRRAVAYLKAVQTEDGCIGAKSDPYMYNHAIATLALAEAYACSYGDRELGAAAQRGVDYLADAQNVGLGWRYSSRSGDSDTSITGWVILALKSAKVAGLEVPRQCFTGALTWLDKLTDETCWRVGYRSKGDAGKRYKGLNENFPANEAMTAVAMISRVWLGAKLTDPALTGGADLLLGQPPEWNVAQGSIDMLYWHFGTLAMFQMGGREWSKWNGAMKKALVDTQRTGTDGRAGSWDPIGAWGKAGGRVYSTAICVLTLETYYRYGRVYK